MKLSTKLKKIYNKAIEENKTIVIIDNQEVLVTYLIYYIQNLENNNKWMNLMK